MQLANENSNSDVTFEHKHITSYFDGDVDNTRPSLMIIEEVMKWESIPLAKSSRPFSIIQKP